MDGTGGVTRFRGLSALMGASPRSAAGMSNQWVSKVQEQPHLRRTQPPRARVSECPTEMLLRWQVSDGVAAPRASVSQP